MAETQYTWMEVHVRGEDGNTDNSKFFEGPLPKIGQAVEMIYVGNSDAGGMRLQLRAKVE